MGGCLRWPVDPELLDMEEEKAPYEDGEESTSAGSHDRPICEGSREQKASIDFAPPGENAEEIALIEEPSDVVSNHRLELLGWLKDTLTTVLEDSSTADALVACADVVLGDDVLIQEEALNETLAMLAGEGVPWQIVEELKERAM